jgi:hypothetical protein
MPGYHFQQTFDNRFSLLIFKCEDFCNLEAIKPQQPKETPESILALTQNAAKTAADKLAAKYPNSKVLFNF